LAHNILCELYEICFEEMPEKTLAMQNHGMNGENPNRVLNPVRVTVSPNPAKEYASFIWDFGNSSITNYDLKITSAEGKVLHTQQLNGAQGQWIWDTRSVLSGIYLYEVTANGLQMASGKVVVAK
jgi:hypothetical protein